MLDAMLGLSAWALCALVLLKLRNLPGNPFALPGRILPGLLVLAVLMPLAYHALCIGRFGQTLGENALGIAVVRQDGAPAGYRRAVLRSVGGMMAILTLGLANLGVLVTRERRGVGDCLADTRVVRLPRL